MLRNFCKFEWRWFEENGAFYTTFDLFDLFAVHYGYESDVLY